MNRLIAGLVAVLGVACGGQAAGSEGQPSTTGGEPAAPAPKQEAMRVEAPLTDALVVSPLVVTGQARGTWYFEATFPVSLLDADGKAIISTYAQAQGEWMTEDFVPFRTELTFAAPTTPTGTLVLEKANPSGLPEHAGEVRVPVRFQ